MGFLGIQGLVRSVGCSLVGFLQSLVGLAPYLYPTKTESIHETNYTNNQDDLRCTSEGGR